MGYKETQSEIIEVEHSISNVNSSIKEYEKLISSKNTELSELDSSISSQKERSKSEQLEKAKSLVSKNFDDELKKLGEDLNSLMEEHELKIGGITYDRYHKKYSKSLPDSESTRKTLDEISEFISEYIGEDFKDRLYKSLEGKYVDINLKQLNKINKTLKKKINELKLFNKISLIFRNKKLVSLKDKLIQLSSPFKDDNSDKESIRNKIILYIVVCLVLSFLFVKWLIAPILIFVLIIGGINIYTNYRLYNLVLECKIVNDNLDKSEDILKSKIQDKVDKDSKREISRFNNKFDAKRKELNDLEEEQNNAIDKCISNFIPDYSNIEKDIEDRKKKLIKEMNEAKLSKDKEYDRIDELSKKLRILKEKLELEIKEEIKSYIQPSQLSDSSVYDPYYLVDVTDKLVFWDSGSTNNFILYDRSSRDSMIKFIRGIALQTLFKLQPRSLVFRIFDEKYGCSDFSDFYTEPLVLAKDSNGTINVQKISGKQNISKYLSGVEVKSDNKSYFGIGLYENIKEFRLNIGKHKTLDNYNAESIKNDADTLPYNISLFLDVDLKEIYTDQFLEMIRIGPMYGFFSFFVYSKEYMKENPEKFLSLVTEIDEIKDKFYVLNNMKLTPFNTNNIKTLVKNKKK